MEKIIPIIIPSYEPDDRFLQLLDDIRKSETGQVVVVNDGSSEEYDHYFTTAEQKYGAILLKHGVNRGKGRALKTAFFFCLENFPEMVGCVTADSDGQHTVSSITQMRDALASHKNALIMGVRDFSGAEIPTKSRFGNTLTRKVFRLLLVYMIGSAFAPLVLLRYFAAAFLAFPMLLVFTLQPE